MTKRTSCLEGCAGGFIVIGLIIGSCIFAGPWLASVGLPEATPAKAVSPAEDGVRQSVPATPQEQPAPPHDDATRVLVEFTDPLFDAQARDAISEIRRLRELLALVPSAVVTGYAVGGPRGWTVEDRPDGTRRIIVSTSRRKRELSGEFSRELLEATARVQRLQDGWPSVTGTIDPQRMRRGDIGRLSTDYEYESLQVLDDESVLLSAEDRRTRYSEFVVFRLEGIDTRDVVTDQAYNVPIAMMVTRTMTYETRGGGSKTIYVLTPLADVAERPRARWEAERRKRRLDEMLAQADISVSSPAPPGEPTR